MHSREFYRLQICSELTGSCPSQRGKQALSFWFSGSSMQCPSRCCYFCGRLAATARTPNAWQSHWGPSLHGDIFECTRYNASEVNLMLSQSPWIWVATGWTDPTTYHYHSDILPSIFYHCFKHFHCSYKNIQKQGYDMKTSITHDSSDSDRCSFLELAMKCVPEHLILFELGDGWSSKLTSLVSRFYPVQHPAIATKIQTLTRTSPQPVFLRLIASASRLLFARRTAALLISHSGDSLVSRASYWWWRS